MAEASNKHKPSGDIENSVELIEGKVDLWTPLNCLVEAANRTKSSRTNSLAIPLAKSESPTTTHGGLDTHGITTKIDLPESVKSESIIPKTKNKDSGHKPLFGDNKDTKSLPSGPAKRRRLRPASQKRVAASEMSASASVMVDATGGKCNRKNSPIWFSLVASEDQ